MRRLFALAVLVIAPLSACTFTTTKSVSSDDLATEISNSIEQQSGTTPDSVTCDGSLEAEVGATTNCTITVNGTEYVAPVEVASVEGSDVKFSVPPIVTADSLETDISERLAAQVGTVPDKIECPGPLIGKVGETVQCVLEHQGGKLPVDVVVTAVEDMNVKYDIEVGTEPIK